MNSGSALLLLLVYLPAAISALAAGYIAFSKNLYRISVALFVELASISILLLGLNMEYVALLVFLFGVFSAITVFFFSSLIMGNLNKPIYDKRWSPARILGLCVGVALGAVTGVVILSSPFLSKVENQPLTSLSMLGEKLLNEHIVVFELLAVAILMLLVGVSLLLRKPADAN